MTQKKLKQLYETHQGKLTDKWSIYLTEYDRIFASYRDAPISLLEIGIQNGGSLEIWADYFPNAQKLIGCDIDPKCAKLSYTDPRVSVVVGDANTNPVQTAIQSISQQFDIVIDDGSHISSDIVKSFARYWPHIVSGGVFVAEDLHCSYWQVYEGGLYEPYSSLAFFKRLSDIINHEHWGLSKKRTDVLQGFFTKYGFSIEEAELINIHSVEFVNSICVIRKCKPAENTLGLRYVAGVDEGVSQNLKRFHLAAAIAFDESANLWANRKLPPDEELPSRLLELAEAKTRFETVTHQLANTKERLQDIEHQLHEVQQQNHDAHQQLKVKHQDLEEALQQHLATQQQLNSVYQQLNVKHQDLEEAQQQHLATQQQLYSVYQQLNVKHQDLEEAQQQLNSKHQQLNVSHQDLEELRQQLHNGHQKNHDAHQQLHAKHQLWLEANQRLQATYQSTSWQLTGPMRFVSRQVKRVPHFISLALPAIKLGGGMVPTAKKAVKLYLRDGIPGIKAGFRYVASGGVAATAPERNSISKSPFFHQLLRRALKLIWWTCTLQLFQRLKAWRTMRDNLLNGPHFSPLTDDCTAAVPFPYRVTPWKAPPSVAVICHMYYSEMSEEFKKYLSNIPFGFDLYITTDTEEKKAAIDSHFSEWEKGPVEIRTAPNRGRDISPKLITCRDVYDRYEFFLHIHTKKSPHDNILSGWRNYLLETLLGSEKIVESIFEAFRVDPRLGIVAPQHFKVLQATIGWGWNFKKAQEFARTIGINLTQGGRVDFPSGSMFWGRSAALTPLLDRNIAIDEFPVEGGQIDGTLGHVIERLYFFVCEAAGYRWLKIGHPALPSTPLERIYYAHDEKELERFIVVSQYELLASQVTEKGEGYRSVIEELKGMIDWSHNHLYSVYARSDYQELGFSRFKEQLQLHMKKQNSLIDFDEEFYLQVNPDVAVAVTKNEISCGYVHYCLTRLAEPRIWSTRQLEKTFSIKPNYPQGLFAPLNCCPLPRFEGGFAGLSKSSSPLLVIMLHYLQDELFFAGYSEFFRDLKPVFDCFTRIVVLVENSDFNENLARKYGDHIEVMPAAAINLLGHSPDLVIAHNSRLANKANEIFGKFSDVVYYCQDFEAGFVPYGARFIDAERAIANTPNVIVSTELLHQFLVKKGLLQRSQRVFVTSPKIETFDVAVTKTKRLFFYFRPEFFNERNLPEILMEAVQDFCEKHTGYEIYMAGTVDTRYSFIINGTPIIVISKLAKEDYVNLISSCDVVVSMIYSAHPGVIAFQAAASGIPTVTNTFENRDAVFLKRMSENIIPYDPVRQSLLPLIEQALSMQKGKKSFADELYAGVRGGTLVQFVDGIFSDRVIRQKNDHEETCVTKISL